VSALIVFCEKQNGSSVRNHPLRAARATPTGQGDALAFSLRLGEFFNYGDSGHALEQFVAALHEAQVVLPQAVPGGKYVTFSSPEQAAALTNRAVLTNDWDQLVEHVRELQGLGNSYFIRLLESSGDRSRPRLFVDRPNARNGEDYEVKAGSIHRISVMVVPGKAAAGHQPDIEVTGDIATPSGPMVKQLDLGVEAQFVVRFRRSFESRGGMLRLWMGSQPLAESRMLPQSASENVAESLADEEAGAGPRAFDEVSSICSPEYVAQVTVLPPWGTFLGALSLVALGTVITSFDKDLAIELGLAFPLATVFLAKALGALMLSLGAIFGFKKLPL